MDRKTWTPHVKWYVLYILGTIVGIAIGQFQNMKYGMVAFGGYLSVFLAYHAVFPYLAIKSPSNKREAITGWIPKVVFPITSFSGWVLLWVLFVK